MCRRLIIFVLVLSCGGQLLAASASDLVSQGNRALEEKKYDEALQAYEQAAKEDPQAPEVYFNKGAALYQKGDFQQAADAFEQSALRSEDARLEALGKFNQGNSAFRGAVGQLQSDPQQALEGVGRSVKLYQDALKLDPKLDDARYNVEVARRTMKRILEEMRKQPQQGQQNQKQQQGQQQQGDPQQQLKQLLEKQEQARRQSEQLARQQQQQGGSQGAASESQELASQQQQIKDETQQLADQMKQSGKPDQRKAAEHLEQAATEQNQAERELGRNQPSDAAPRQQEAEDEIGKAMAAMNGEKPPEPQPNEDQKHQQAAQKNARRLRDKQSKEARQNAQDILNQERANRRQRDLAIMSRTRPVDKDW
jgi:Ca-activated chloride channel family protein